MRRRPASTRSRCGPAAALAPLAAIVAYQVCFARLQGGAAVLLGEPEKARGFYLQALAACEKIRFRPEIALVHEIKVFGQLRRR